MEKKQAFRVDAECRSCGGYGLYVGMAERKECAVVCHTCKGSGREKIVVEYVPFEERHEKKGVKRVFKASFGYGHSADDVTTEEGKVIQFSKGGVTYEDWLKGKKPKPVKDLYCPYQWTDQSLQLSDHPQMMLYKTRCTEGLKLGGLISKCKYFPCKNKCWEIYEELGGK